MMAARGTSVVGDVVILTACVQPAGHSCHGKHSTSSAGVQQTNPAGHSLWTVEPGGQYAPEAHGSALNGVGQKLPAGQGRARADPARHN